MRSRSPGEQESSRAGEQDARALLLLEPLATLLAHLARVRVRVRGRDRVRVRVRLG